MNEVQLNERHRHILEFARTTCGGPGAWRHRKLAEVGDLLALAQISGRLKIEWLDVSVDLRAVVELRVPWLSTGRSLAQVAERTFKNIGARRSNFTTAAALARVIFNQTAAPRPRPRLIQELLDELAQ